MAPPKSAAVNHNAVLAAAECFALGKDGLSAKLCRAAVQILLQTGDGPLGPHSMVSTAYGAQLCKSVQQKDWHSIPPPRLHNVLQDIPFIHTGKVPGLQHAVMVLDTDALLAQAGAHGPGTGTSKQTHSTGQQPQQRVVDGSESTPLANGPPSALHSSTHAPLLHTQHPVTPRHLAQVLPAARAATASVSAATAAAAASSLHPLPGMHTDAASFVLQLMAMAVFRPKSAEDHATHLRCFAACFLARHKDRSCPVPNSCDIKLLGALLNRAGSPEQQALMNYKPHIVHGGQKVQALATLDALHVLQLDPPEPAHPPHFVPAGAGNRQQRIVLCVEALQAAAKAAVGNMLGIGPLSILPLPHPTPVPHPTASDPTAPGKRHAGASVKCQLRVFDERAAGQGHAQQSPPAAATLAGTQTPSIGVSPTEAALTAAAAAAAAEAVAGGPPGLTSGPSAPTNVTIGAADDFQKITPQPAHTATTYAGALAAGATPAADPDGPSEARPVVLRITVHDDEPECVAAGQPPASAADAAAPYASMPLPLEQEQAHAHAAQLAGERQGGGAAGDEADDDGVQCPDLATCVREVYQAAADRAAAQSSNRSGSGSMPTARVADGVAVALLKQYVATHLLSVISGPVGPHSITGPHLGMLLNQCPLQLLKLYESLPKPRMRSLLMRPVEDGPGGLTNYYDDGILRAVHHKDNLGIALDVVALQDAWRKDQAAAAVARNSTRQHSHPSTSSHKAHARAAALSAKVATAPTAPKFLAVKAAAAAAAAAATAAATAAPSKPFPVVGSTQPQPLPLFDPCGSPHCPDLATCVHAVYAGDTLKRVLALALCMRPRDTPPLGAYACAGPDIGTMLQKNPESAPHYNALGTPKLRKLLEAKAPPGEGSGGGPNRPALAPDDGILCSVPVRGNQGVRLNVAALQEAYLKLRMPGGKQHAANATSGAGYSSSSTTTTTTTHTNTSIVSAPALPAAAAAASLNPSDSKGLAVCMACLSMWAQPDSSGAYGFGSQAGVALASLAATIISQPHYHAVSNGGANRYQLRHAARVIERTLNMLWTEGWGGTGPIGGQIKSPSAVPQLVLQVLRQGAPWLRVFDHQGQPTDFDALAIANIFAEASLFVELQVEALSQHVVEALSPSALASPTKDSVHTLMREKVTGRLIPKPKTLPPKLAAGWPPELGMAPAQKVLKFLQQYTAKSRTRLRVVLVQLLEEAGLLQQQQQQQQAKMTTQEQAGIGSSSSSGGALSPHAHVLALCLEQLSALATNSQNGVLPTTGVSSSSGSGGDGSAASSKPQTDASVTLLQHPPHATTKCIQEGLSNQCSPLEQGTLNRKGATHHVTPASTPAPAAAAAVEEGAAMSKGDRDVGTEPLHHPPLQGPHGVDLGPEAVAQQHWDAFSPTPQRARAALEARLAAQAGGMVGMPMPQPVPMHGAAVPPAAAYGAKAGQAQQQHQQHQQQVQLGVLDWCALDDAVDNGAAGVSQHGNASGWGDSKKVHGPAYSRTHDSSPSVPQQSNTQPPSNGSAVQPHLHSGHYDQLYAQQQQLEQQKLGVPPSLTSTLLPSCWQQQEEGVHGWGGAGTGAGGVPDSAGGNVHSSNQTSPGLVPNEGLLAAKSSAQQQQQQQQSGMVEVGAGGEDDEGMDDDDLLALLVGGGAEKERSALAVRPRAFDPGTSSLLSPSSRLTRAP